MLKIELSTPAQKIHIAKNIYLLLPKDYKPVYLPGRNKWLEALRSGKYRRTTGTLCETKNKQLCYCCLGVLSKTQNRLKKMVLNTKSEVVGPYTLWVDDNNRSTMLSTSNPVFSVLYDSGKFPNNVKVVLERENDSDVTFESLAKVNDYTNLGFKSIAKIIELVWTEKEHE